MGGFSRCFCRFLCFFPLLFLFVLIYFFYMKQLISIILFFTVATMFSSCNNFLTNSESIAASEADCSIGMFQEMRQEQLDSLHGFCKTIYVRQTVTLYKDTIYDDSVITKHNYTSFVYFDRYMGKNDTLVKLRAQKTRESGPCGSVPVYCELDSSGIQKTFSCDVSEVCYMYEHDVYDAVSSALPNEIREMELKYKPYNAAYCRKSGYKCVIDTVYHDAYHTTLRKEIYDTLFLNYGANAWTDYIPAINAPPFDTAAFRNALDTLDTQGEIFGMDTLFTGYNVSIDGLPKWVVDGANNHCMKQDSMVVCAIVPYYSIRYMGMFYPSVYEKKPFYLANWLDEPLERDTVITWTLKYNYRDGSYRGSSGSLTITTLFKGKNDYN